MIASARIRLRAPTIVDAPELAAEGNDREVSAGLCDHFPHPYTVDDALRFVETVQAQTGPRRQFIVEVDGEVAGVAGLLLGSGVYRLNAELSYWLGRRFWGRGIMTHVIGRLVDLGWDDFEVDRLFARVFGVNTASLRVLEKNKFRVEAHVSDVIIKRGRVVDEVTLGLRRPADRPPPRRR